MIVDEKVEETIFNFFSYSIEVVWFYAWQLEKNTHPRIKDHSPCMN